MQVCVCVYLHVGHHKEVGDFGSVINKTVPVQQINGSTGTQQNQHLLFEQIVIEWRSDVGNNLLEDNRIKSQ